MIGVEIFHVFELKKEILIFISLTTLYVTYYLFEVVKKPILICRVGDFRNCLEKNVPLLKEPYWPTPWCIESRLQTVLGHLFRSFLLPSAKYHREILKLSDGGQVALDWVNEQKDDNRPIMLVLPGITGDSQAEYIRSLVAAAEQLNVQCVIFNNRGLGGIPLTTPRVYCAVSHDDLFEVVEAIRFRGSLLLAVGVSMGGLVLANYLAEHGERSAINAAFILSSPLDVMKGTESLEQPIFNALLSRSLAGSLYTTLRSHKLLNDQPLDWAAIENSRSIRQFDAAFTSKHFGFRDVDHYYRTASLKDKLHRIRTPLLCLCAADDPMQPIHALPIPEAEESECVALTVTARGGHIGFMEGFVPIRSPERQYTARLCVQYFSALLSNDKLLHYPTSVDISTSS